MPPGLDGALVDLEMLAHRLLDAIPARHLVVGGLTALAPPVLRQERVQPLHKVIVLYPPAESGSEAIRIHPAQDSALEVGCLEKGARKPLTHASANESVAAIRNRIRVATLQLGRCG